MSLTYSSCLPFQDLLAPPAAFSPSVSMHTNRREYFVHVTPDLQPFCKSSDQALVVSELKQDLIKQYILGYFKSKEMIGRSFEEMKPALSDV